MKIVKIERGNEMKIDHTDRKILHMLSENSRLSFVEIGDVLALSRVTVRERIKRLQREGIIESFTIQLNPVAIKKNVTVIFMITCVPACLVKAAHQLMEHSQVETCYQITGPSMLHVCISFESIEELEKFQQNTIESIEGILQVETHMVLKKFAT